MNLLSWNVNKRWPVDAKGDRTAEIKAVRPDIVTLQEVKRKSADDWADHLEKIGLVHHYRSGDNTLVLSHQCLIASRWKLTHNDIPRPREAPYPESLGRATVSVPDIGDIDVFTAHIPNGEGNGWKKIDTFRVLAAELRRANNSPRILTGDFNEPEWCPKLGRIAVWGEGKRVRKRWRDKFGDERPSIEWANGVRSVLDGAASKHRLRDAYRDRHGPSEDTPITYRTTRGNNPKCFDHTFVSKHFDVLACCYHHEWREKGLSDHSPMWTRLRLRSDLLPLG